MFLCKKVVQEIMVLDDIDNFLEWILGRKSWLIVYNASNSWFLVGLEGRTKSYVSHEAAMKVVESVGLGIAALFQ